MLSENTKKDSEFACFKSHHTFNESYSEEKKDIYKIIYIIRDPRDVVISSLHYFNVPFFKLKKIIQSFRHGLSIYKRVEFLLNIFKSKKAKKRIMINMVLNGDERVNIWCKYSWKEHFLSYYEKKDVLFISYENLLANPYDECVRILNELNSSKNPKHIKTSITRQSFDERKKNNTYIINEKHMRLGKSQYWKKEFSDEEKLIFEQKLKKELLLFNYEY